MDSTPYDGQISATAEEMQPRSGSPDLPPTSSTVKLIPEPTVDDSITQQFKSRKFRDIVGLVVFLLMVLGTLVYGILNLKRGGDPDAGTDYSDCLGWFLFSVAVAEAVSLIFSILILALPHMGLWLTLLVVLLALTWLGFVLIIIEDLWGAAIALWGCALLVVIASFTMFPKLRITKELLCATCKILRGVLALPGYSLLFMIMLIAWAVLWLTVAATWHWGPNPRHGVDVNEASLWEYILFTVVFLWVTSTIQNMMYLTSCRMISMWYYNQMRSYDCCGAVGTSCQFAFMYHMGSCFWLAPLRCFLWWSVHGFTHVFVGLHNASVVQSFKKTSASLQLLRKAYHVRVFEVWLFILSTFTGIVTGTCAAIFANDSDWTWFAAAFGGVFGWQAASVHLCVWIAAIRTLWVVFFAEPKLMLYKQTTLHNVMLACLAHETFDRNRISDDVPIVRYLQDVGDPRKPEEPYTNWPEGDYGFPIEINQYVQQQKDRDREWKEWKQHVDTNLKTTKVHLVNLDAVMQDYTTQLSPTSAQILNPTPSHAPRFLPYEASSSETEHLPPSTWDGRVQPAPELVVTSPSGKLGQT